VFEDAPELELIEEMNKDRHVVFYESRFSFLKAINGIRPSCTHGLLAPTGMGKSTLTRSIICDTAKTHRVGVILSEERPIEYSSGFITQGEAVNWGNLRFLKETDITTRVSGKEAQIDALIAFAVEHDITVLFWDNITTGTILGDSVKPAYMATLLDRLKEKLMETKIALFYIAHTNKTVKAEQSTLIQGEDVRGSNQYYMKADYFFILQVKTKNDEKIAFVRITKNRFHQPKIKEYVLEFITNRYTRDIGVPLSKILEIFEKDKKNESTNKFYPRY